MENAIPMLDNLMPLMRTVTEYNAWLSRQDHPERLPAVTLSVTYNNRDAQVLVDVFLFANRDTPNLRYAIGVRSAFAVVQNADTKAEVPADKAIESLIRSVKNFMKEN